MMQSGLEQPMYRSTLECWRKIYRAEGVSSFYRGALSNVFRSTGAAAILVLYDEVKKFMNWGRLEQELVFVRSFSNDAIIPQVMSQN